MGTEPPDWLDHTILSAIAAGAQHAEIVALLAGSLPQGDADVAAHIADLTRRGLLEVANDAQLGLRITSEGRLLILQWGGAIAANVRQLEEERRQVDRLRTELLSTMSHELRTPLTLIRTSIGLLLDSDPDLEMQQRLLRNIKQSTDRMHTLVTDLLDLARLRGNHFELQWRRVDLNALATGAASLMRPLLDEKGQAVSIAAPEGPLVVPGDFRRLERVLLNLISNANKFAEPGTSISITLRSSGSEAIIAVQDDGPGIPASAMPHLFDQFFTARTSSSSHNIGAGLGLPIAKGIMEAHGGRIWVESNVGAGTTVFLALPTTWPTEDGDEDPGR